MYSLYAYTSNSGVITIHYNQQYNIEIDMYNSDRLQNEVIKNLYITFRNSHNRIWDTGFTLTKFLSLSDEELFQLSLSWEFPSGWDNPIPFHVITDIFGTYKNTSGELFNIPVNFISKINIDEYIY